MTNKIERKIESLNIDDVITNMGLDEEFPQHPKAGYGPINFGMVELPGWCRETFVDNDGEDWECSRKPGHTGSHVAIASGGFVVGIKRVKV